MASEKFLITGAFGCIGAWAVKRLIDEGTPVYTYDLPGNYGGADYRLLLPASVLMGGIFLVVADTVARTGLGATEIPVGVVTALCGGPFFIYLLRKEGTRTLE